MPASTGQLLIVGTPIGNLGDLSTRATEALSSADAIACEDTRRTGGLLHHLGISGKDLLVANEHTEYALVPKVIDRLHAGEVVAVVSDAGMPGISDPGERLIAAAIDAGIDVTVIPGPTAVDAALVVSGLPTRRFVFEGFLPKKGGERAEQLLAIAAERRTVVLYESPNRTEATLRDLANVCGGDRRVAVARELTKLHEEVWRGELDDAVAWAERGLKGEVVIVVAGAPVPEEATDDDIVARLRSAIVDKDMSVRDAVSQVVDELGVRKNRAKNLANSIGKPG